MHPNGIITLITDFGQIDGYVGAMKGVILGIAPEARIIDITHAIRPQDTHQAAYILQTCYRYFPAGTIHLVVVDPGVGGARRAVALATPEALFVGPDNGVLTYAWQESVARWGAGQCALVELAEQRFWLPDVSSTFHGRDIFAPAAAHLARGVPLEAFGPRLSSPAEIDLAQPVPQPEGGLEGRIIHVDHFGNCITNITPLHLDQAGLVSGLLVEIAGQRISGLSRTYAEGAAGAPIALIGSSNRLEVAVRNSSAAQALGVDVGEPVWVRSGGSASSGVHNG